MKQTLFIILAILTGSLLNIQAQSIPVGLQTIEDNIRRQQLDAGSFSNLSFCIRPLYHFTIINDSANINEASFKQYPKKVKYGFLPVSIFQQYNSKLPYGWNDGPMIPAKGYQTLISGGAYFNYSHLEIQIKPELVYAQNSDFPVFFSYTRSNTETYNYIHLFQNLIDQPEKFGSASYSKLLAGQSYIRLRYGKFAMGFSTENMWWGPGIRNSLIMTNNAAGFPHFSIQTTSPVKTGIGSFEAIMIMGNLKNSNTYSFDTSLKVNGTKVFHTKNDSGRYVNGLSITYQPKWLPGLFLGANRLFVAYVNNRPNNFTGFFPVFSTFFKNTNGFLADSVKYGQIASLFFRLLLPKEKAEVYGEYGRNDHSWNLTDFILQPEHSGAYILGVKKIFDLKPGKPKIECLLEVSHLEEAKTIYTRPQTPWYTHSLVRQGFTQEGQVLGAGIGPGSNSQTFQTTIFSKKRSYGYKFERVVNNNDYQYITYSSPKKPWVTLSNSLFFNQQFKNILVSANINYIKVYNYEWVTNYQNPNNYWDYKGNDFNNFQLQLSLTYLIN